MLHLSAHLILSADAKVSTRRPSASVFGLPIQHDQVIGLRYQADALLVDHITLIADPKTIGINAQEEEIHDERLKACKNIIPALCIANFFNYISSDFTAFHEWRGPIHVFGNADHEMIGNATCHPIPQTQDLLKELRHVGEELGWKRVHCEGGPTLLRYLLLADAVDELHLTICPSLFGGHSAPTMTRLLPEEYFPASLTLEMVNMSVVKNEVFLTYRKK